MVEVFYFALQMGHRKFIKTVKFIIIKLKNGYGLSLPWPWLIVNLILTFFVLSICKPRTILNDPKVAPCIQNCLLSVEGILITIEACAVKTELIQTFQCIIFVQKQRLILKEKVDIHGKKDTQIALQPKRLLRKDDPRLSLWKLNFYFSFSCYLFILSCWYEVNIEITISLKIKLMNTPKIACPKLIYQCRKHPVSACVKILSTAFFSQGALSSTIARRLIVQCIHGFNFG